MATDMAYGFIGLEHLFGQRIKEVGVERVRGLIEATTTAWNTEINAMMGGWATRSTIAKERVELPGSGTLEPLDETGWGNPTPAKEFGHYDVGYPIQAGGAAWGTNRVTAALMTLDEANRQMLFVMRKDANWLRQRMLAAIFGNAEWTYTDKFLGDVAVKPLANGDSVTFLKNGQTQPSTSQHYLAQAQGISDAYNPIPTIYDLLQAYPSKSGPYVVYIPTNLKSTIEALSDFTKVNDPDIDPAITRDRIIAGNGQGDRAVAFPGGRIFGKTDYCWIVEWRALPDNYMIGVAMGAGKFLRLREWDDTSLQGLFPEYYSPDGNLNLNRFIRYAGFGVYNRVAAVVCQIGNASYTPPTGFVTPLP
ncbi:MAG: hypothetical protein WCG26_01090 [Chloroflexales bacterium]